MLMSALNRASAMSAPRQALTAARKPVSDDFVSELEESMMAVLLWTTWLRAPQPLASAFNFQSAASITKPRSTSHHGRRPRAGRETSAFERYRLNNERIVQNVTVVIFINDTRKLDHVPISFQRDLPDTIHKLIMCNTSGTFT